MSRTLFSKPRISSTSSIGGIINLAPRIIANGDVGTEIKLISFGNAELIEPEADILFNLERAAETARREKTSISIQIVIIGFLNNAILAGQAVSMTDHLSVSCGSEALIASINSMGIGKHGFAARIKEISSRFSNFPNIFIQARSIETQAISYEAIGVTTLADESPLDTEWFIAPAHVGISPWHCAAQKAEEEIAIQISHDFDCIWLQSELVNLDNIPSAAHISKQIRSSISW